MCYLQTTESNEMRHFLSSVYCTTQHKLKFYQHMTQCIFHKNLNSDLLVTIVIQHNGVIGLTAVPSTVQSALPDRWEESASAQKLHWTGKESCWSASSPYFFPGMNTDTVRLSSTEKISEKHFYKWQDHLLLPNAITHSGAIPDWMESSLSFL